RIGLDRIDGENERGVPGHRFVQGETHKSETPGTDDHRWLAFQRRYLFQGAEGGHARASERGSALRRKVADVEQVARMRHHQIIGIAAVRKYAEAAHGAAEIFLPPLARTAGPAADPWMCKPAIANLDAFCVGPECHHLADIL